VYIGGGRTDLASGTIICFLMFRCTIYEYFFKKYRELM